MHKGYLFGWLALGCFGTLSAASVTVTMNTLSTTMTLQNIETSEMVEVGEPDDSHVYTFKAPAGEYLLTGIATDGKTINGAIKITITEDAEQAFSVWTPTVYANNKTDGTMWSADVDYTVELRVINREGEDQYYSIGNSTTAGRRTFLIANGNTYLANLIPNEAHQAEGYVTYYLSGTATRNATVSGAIPMGADFTLTVPTDAEFVMARKRGSTHFIPFDTVEPTAKEVDGDFTKLTYRLANSQQYNYRTWKDGGLTLAGIFTMSTTAANCPTLAFTDADYEAFGAKTVKHDATWNSGYETGDIFVNINERGHLAMNVGDTFKAHAMRTWEITNNLSTNYFIEPDFHYTVIDTEGNPSTDVISIDNADTTTDPWSTITAVGEGTAIVLVTYDALCADLYNTKAVKAEFVGGEYWSAIWPENTAAYVVTVGATESSVTPNMVINEEANSDTLKLAGANVDAEHDVFYYLDSEEGYEYTFTPEGAASIEIAYPTIGENMATYTGFGTEGVTRNGDGSYTLLLKEGRQIVRLTDEAGNAAYQVLTAKPCHMELSNVTREDSEEFYPGDQVKVQFSGLFHPANKISGIYNMSAFIAYTGLSTGEQETVGTANQYMFGSKAEAQAVTITIPGDYDTDLNPYIELTDGAIKVSGFGDPIGNHRNTSYFLGRSPNFTAVSHNSYFGALPNVLIPVSNEGNQSGVATISDVNSGVETYYDLQGRRLTAPQRGITIVRHADGSVAKVIEN
jgi:hypothetical protein